MSLNNDWSWSYLFTYSCWLTNRPIDWETSNNQYWLAWKEGGGFIRKLTDWLTVCQLLELSVNCLRDKQTKGLKYWLADWRTNGLSDWQTEVRQTDRLSQTLTFGTNTIHKVEVVLKRIQIAVTIKDASNWLSWTNVTTGVPTTQAITTL